MGNESQSNKLLEESDKTSSVEQDKTRQNLLFFKTNVSPFDVALGLQKEPQTSKERLNDKGKVTWKVNTSEEYLCVVSRFQTLLF